MKAIYKVAALVALLAAFSSCNKNEGGASGKSIRLWSVEENSTPLTRADEVNRNLQPLFVFWTDGNFNDATKTAPDFFVRTPDGEISDYTTDTYNTGVYYPLYDQEVFANGIAPAPGEGYLEFVTDGDYSKFTLGAPTVGFPDDEYGATDVLAAAATVTGKDSDPFAPTYPLIFKHLTTKISFQAKLDQTMTKFVKYVTVKIPGSLAPVTLEWNATTEAYEVKGSTTAQDFVFGNFWTEDGRFVSRNPRANWTQYYQLTFDYQNMGFTHILPPGDSMDVTVQFKMANNMSDFDTQTGITDMEVPVTIDFVDNTGAAVELKAGDAYLVQFNINVFDIELIGRKVAWEDGGYIAIPIQIR